MKKKSKSCTKHGGKECFFEILFSYALNYNTFRCCAFSICCYGKHTSTTIYIHIFRFTAFFDCYYKIPKKKTKEEKTEGKKALINRKHEKLVLYIFRIYKYYFS